ncbi:hypothetical protein Lac2_12670 [Claveliimonas bilis]|uniref:pentapeptide repeat-containing protein n=1 Tax=Claveliimonas bilis TaxID=3028070 RepID=UPI002930AB68|nr:pentapeptide repeat-containing protein [Claveliimonas bilis]BDZ83133.1 hypothetical protein Lac2_12670 [Claveliimonas bilis]
MEYYLDEYEFELPNNTELERSIEVLLEHSKNKSRFRKDPFITAVGGTDCSDYTGKSIRRSKFAHKTFSETLFINSAAAGSTFSNCNFNKCKFINANFQECTFTNSIIQKNINNNAIAHCNFDRSLFSDEFRLFDIEFQHSVFRQTAFIDGTIQDVTFFSSTLQDTIFSNIILNGVRFNDLNIDYSIFENVHMDNVILPFSQICFTFGLLTYLMSTQDNVCITSAQKNNGTISKDEFLSLLPNFETYYLGTSDFFPLTNIYLSQGRYNEAQKALLSGILLATTNCDFRQIKYLCKLIYTYSVFSFHQRKRIYDYINEHISFNDMNPSLLYNYTTYKNEISSYLLTNNRSGIVTSEIDIVTNIFPYESKKLGILLSVLEEIIEQNKSQNGEHSIICRHNSAEEIIVTIQDIYQSLYLTIPVIYSALIGIFILEDKWNKYLSNKLNRKNANELKNIELERARVALEREKLALKKEQADFEAWQLKQNKNEQKIRTEILRRNISENDIEISSISHITYGDIPSNINKNISQYSYTKKS